MSMFHTFLVSQGGEPELGDLNGVFGRSLVLGGIYMLDMLCIPPLPKKIKVTHTPLGRVRTPSPFPWLDKA